MIETALIFLSLAAATAPAWLTVLVVAWRAYSATRDDERRAPPDPDDCW